jgi:hypothetical protein
MTRIIPWMCPEGAQVELYRERCVPQVLQLSSEVSEFKPLLCGDRVEYIETSPTVTRLSHLRVCTFMAVLLSLARGCLITSTKHSTHVETPSHPSRACILYEQHSS